MSKACVTISIDLELAWGNWDNLREDHRQHIEQCERPVVQRLIEIFDRYRLPATWAFVAALLDRVSAQSMPGGAHLWFAPDLIEAIIQSKVSHDLGSHGGRHHYFDVMSQTEASEDIEFARYIHKLNGLPLSSFVFPRNKVAKLELLRHHGFKVYRGVDHAWHQRLRARQVTLGRVANLLDKCFPISPEAVAPLSENGLVNLPGSMLFMGRNGLRRLVSSNVLETKLQKGVKRAVAQRGVFHLWFHPSNFWYQTENQLVVFERFVANLAELVGRGDIEMRTMASYGRCDV